MRAPPTTVEIIEELALRDPSPPALREQDETLSYGELYDALVQCGLLLERLGVRRGQRVAIAGPSFGVQLVLLLAAEGLGAVTASFGFEGDTDAPFLFENVDWVFAGVAQRVPAGTRFHLTDAAFARQLVAPLPAGARPAWSAPELHEPQRITRTSGSTGRSKFMLLSRGVQEQWVVTGTEKISYGPATRLLVLAPFVTNGALARSSCCLRRGGMVIGGGSYDAAAMELTHVWGLPVHVDALIRRLPPGYTSPRPVDVATVGGAMSPVSRDAAARAFGGWVKNRYGSNEVGGVCEELDTDGTGLLCAGAEVRILGPDGREVPPGQEGTMAFRTQMMPDGYLNAPQESAAAFVDGWYISNDVGAMVGPRRMRLVGRRDDLINIGGLKVPAATLEAAIRAQPAIADCALQAVYLDAASVTLGVALVLAAGASADAATAQMEQALRAAGGATVRVLIVSALPRLPGGKTDRLALLRMFSG